MRLDGLRFMRPEAPKAKQACGTEGEEHDGWGLGCDADGAGEGVLKGKVGNEGIGVSGGVQVVPVEERVGIAAGGCVTGSDDVAEAEGGGVGQDLVEQVVDVDSDDIDAEAVEIGDVECPLLIKGVGGEIGGDGAGGVAAEGWSLSRMESSKVVLPWST